MGRLLEIARSSRKTVIPVAVTLDALCEKPAATAPRRRSVPVRVAKCPGCSKPIGDVTTQWEGVSVCGECHVIATANPGGFGLTLARHCRADAAISQRYEGVGVW